MLKDLAALELGNEIKRRREALGWTLPELAERADLTPNYIGTIENGLRDPSISTLRAIARGLGIEPGELLTQAPELSAEALEIAKLVDKVPSEVRHSVRAILAAFLRLRRR
jgi:transcriptional regulator with XRE-family HTH domain